MHAARVAMAASQRLAGGPVFSAPPPPPPSPAAGFSSSPAMGTSFAASGLLGSSGGACEWLGGREGVWGAYGRGSGVGAGDCGVWELLAGAKTWTGAGGAGPSAAGFLGSMVCGGACRVVVCESRATAKPSEPVCVCVDLLPLCVR